jgi:hypothetical protein
MVDARTATAADFERAAQRHANLFWVWLVVAALAWWLVAPVWAAIPGLLALFSAVSSVAATRSASKLREGSYAIANPNNGAAEDDEHRRA